MPTFRAIVARMSSRQPLAAFVDLRLLQFYPFCAKMGKTVHFSGLYGGVPAPW